MPEKISSPADAERFKNKLRFWFTVAAMGSFLSYPVILAIVFNYFGGNVAALVTIAFIFDVGVSVFMVSRFPDVEISSRYLGLLRYLTFTYIRWEHIRSAEIVEGESSRSIVVTYLTSEGGPGRARITMSGFSGTDRERLKELIFEHVPQDVRRL
jgi:hypothetical protein